MCRLPMLSAALLLVFVGVLPEAIHCMPVGDDDMFTGGVMNLVNPGKGLQCHDVELRDHYCSRVMNSSGHSSKVFFPNPRGHETLEDAIREFNDFIPLLKSGCHEKLGTFLCFIYFPFCTDDYPSLRIYPCKEVCEDITDKDGECTRLVSQVAGWNDQLECNSPHYLPQSSLQCADGVAPSYPGSANSTDSEEPTETSESMPSATSTEAPTGSSTDSEEPTKTSEEECNNDSNTCPKDCDSRVRNNANQGTFKRHQNQYCYAARVTVKSQGEQGCRHAYTVEVKDQYNLKTPFNGTHSIKAPSMGDSAVILGGPSHCDSCPKLDVSKTYLIAGPYSRAPDGSVQWELGDSKSTALVSEWKAKYNTRIDSFITGGNEAREDDPDSFTRCEMDAKLVSTEQWSIH